MAFVKRLLDRSSYVFGCSRPTVSSQEVFRTDAKCETSKIVVGGHEVNGSRWFCLPVLPTELPMLFKEDGQSQWASSPAELLGTMVALQAFGCWEMVLVGQVILKDNKSNEAILARSSRTKWPPFLFNMQLAEHLMLAGTRIGLRWRPIDDNEPADDFTNEDFSRFDPKMRVDVKLSDIDLSLLWSMWEAHDDFLDRSAWRSKHAAPFRSKNEKSSW